MKPNTLAEIRGRFEVHLAGFFHAHRWVVGVFLAALAADAISTSYFLISRPGEEELHPAVSAAIGIAGPIAGPMIGFFGKAIPGLFVAIYLRRWARVILLSASGISLFAAWYNVWGATL